MISINSPPKSPQVNRSSNFKQGVGCVPIAKKRPPILLLFYQKLSYSEFYPAWRNGIISGRQDLVFGHGTQRGRGSKDDPNPCLKQQEDDGVFQEPGEKACSVGRSLVEQGAPAGT